MTTASFSLTERRRHPVRWLRDLLRADILRGAFAEGVLPSEANLMLGYASTRGVVREALDLLRREGVIERVQGTGTLVVAQRYERRLVEVHGITEIDAASFSAHVLEQRALPMPRVVAEHLDEAPGAPCLMIEYLGMALGGIVGVYTNYLRYPEAERVAAIPFHGHWYTLLAEAGLDIGETDLLIEAMVADDVLSGQLSVPVGRPLLAMQQVIRDSAGRPYDFAILRHRADRLAMSSYARRPDRDTADRDTADRDTVADAE
ncbi:MAG: transcriptional regulator, GntR family with sensor domain protein [Pseudonocardiales bacterium]|nr:transcriptional regulator, GntR family with sensor domain protein [Pseudonocardiales bacterium]